MIYTCFRCGTEQTRQETRPSSKIKGLSEETSRLVKMCKNCKCRIFLIRGDEV